MAKNNFQIRLGRDWATKFSYSNDISAIKRNDILRYITVKNPKIKHSEIIQNYIDIIKEKYPIIKILEKIYNDFHEALMGKNPEKLNTFIDNYENAIIKDFVAGIKDDIAPVINAVMLDVNSGFVEGCNNKFKLVKRILYGRSNLNTLFKKCYFAFKSNSDDFNIQKLLQEATVSLK